MNGRKEQEKLPYRSNCRKQSQNAVADTLPFSLAGLWPYKPPGTHECEANFVEEGGTTSSWLYPRLYLNT